MTKDEWVMLDPEDRECEGCQYPAECEEYTIREKGSLMLCEICASTPIGSVVRSPEQWNREHRDIMQTIGWIGNKLIDLSHKR